MAGTKSPERDRQKTKRRPPRRVLAGCTLALLGLAALTLVATAAWRATTATYGVDRVREAEIASGDVASALDGYRVAFVSDVHLGNNYGMERLNHLIDEINAAGCDCVVLGGDYARDGAWLKNFAQAAARLRARDGVYTICGNHDVMIGRDKIARALKQSGIVFLDQAEVTLANGLTIVGIGDFRFGKANLDEVSARLRPSDFAILAAHNPDVVETTGFADYSDRFDLVLAGHTHGGQITLGGWAPFIPSAYGQRYRTGTVQKDGVPVVVSNGVGYGGYLLHFRLWAPSDFLVITLRKSARTSAE